MQILFFTIQRIQSQGPAFRAKEGLMLWERKVTMARQERRFQDQADDFLERNKAHVEELQRVYEGGLADASYMGGKREGIWTIRS